MASSTAEFELNRVLLSLSLQLRRLQERSERLASQCKGLKRTSQTPDLGKLRGLQDQRNTLTKDLFRVLTYKQPLEPLTSSVYATISEMLTSAQSSFFELLNRNKPEYQAKTQATELFLALSDGIWGELQRLRSNSETREVRETFTQAAILARELDATITQIHSLETAYRESLTRNLDDLKEKNQLLTKEIDQLEAQTRTRGYTVTDISSRSSPEVLFNTQDKHRFRSTESTAVPALDLPVRSTFGGAPMHKSFTNRDRHQLSTLKNQVTWLKSQLAVLHSNPYTAPNSEEFKANQEALETVLKEKSELERLILAADNQRQQSERQHKAALDDLTTDCQDLNRELQLKKQENAHIKTQLQLLQTENLQSIQQLITSEIKKMETNYAKIEAKVTKTEQKLDEIKFGIETKLKETLQKVENMNEIEQILIQEREKFEMIIKQQQEWNESKLEKMTRNVTESEENALNLALELENERAKNDKLTAKLAEFETTESEKDTINRLREELEANMQQIENYQDRFALLMSEISQLRYEKTVLEERVADLQGKESQWQLEKASLTEELQRITEKEEGNAEALQAAQQTIAKFEIKEEFEDWKSKIKALESVIEEKESQLLASNAHHAAELLEQRTELEARLHSLQSELADHRDSVKVEDGEKRYFIQVRSAEPSAMMRSDPSHRDSELQKSKEELVETSRRNETLEREVDRLQSSNTKMRGDRVHLEAELSKARSLTTLCDLLKGEIDRLKAEMKTLTEQNQRLKAANEPLTGTLEDYEARIENYRQQLQDQTRRCEELEADVQDLKLDGIQTKQQLVVALNEAKRNTSGSTSSEISQLKAREMQLNAQIKNINEEIENWGREMKVTGGNSVEILRSLRQNMGKFQEKSHISAINIDENPSKQLEIDNLRSEIAQLKHQISSFEQQKSQELTHLREEYHKQLSDKEQFISLLVQSRQEEPSPIQPSPDFDLTPEEAVVIEESAEERKESMKDLRALMEIETEPGAVLKTVEYNGQMWELICDEKGEFEWVREGDLPKFPEIAQITSLLQSVISPFTTLTSAVSSLIHQFTEQKSLIASLQDDSKRTTSEDSSLASIRAMFVNLIGELPKLSVKGETLLRTVLTRFKFTMQQISLLDRARTAKSTEKSALLAQALN